MAEVVVTRGSQITLTRDVRERLGIEEGDIVVVNVFGGTATVSKKDPRVFRTCASFLPENFERVLKGLREDPQERLKRLGIL